MLMGVRPYVPTMGRFLQVDPVDGGSLNSYEYAGQDPINAFDLDGAVGDHGIRL
jgi:RHS repeat-associated protein